ncbi:MAG: extracellular solute-binding protein [Eubacteriales bacterium]|nr:extracellular solute-binding protein [Eubacteriales bacterium]
MEKRIVLIIACILSVLIFVAACGPNPTEIQQNSIDGESSVLESVASNDEISDEISSDTSSDVDVADSADESELISQQESVTESHAPITVSEAEEEIKKLDLKGASITYLVHWDPNGNDARLLKTRFKTYCNGNIVFINAPYEKLGEKLSSMIMGGDSPDIYAVRSWDFPALMYKDVFQELDSKIDFESSIWIGDKSQYDQFLWKGKHYLVGGSGPTTYIWYNKRLMDEYGIEKNPGDLVKENKWDWNSFLDIAREMTDPEEGIYGLSDSGMIYAFMSGLGEELIKFTQHGIESNVKSANIATAHQFYSDLYIKHKVINPSPNHVQEFANSKSAMYYGGHWEAAQDPIKKMHDSGDVTFTHIPKAPGASTYMYPGSVGGHAIPKGAKNIQGAVAFLTMGQVSKAYADEERAKWHETSNHNAQEIIIIDESYELTSYPIYSFGINAASSAYWSILDELRGGANWSTLSEKLDPLIEKAIADLQK